MHTTPRQGHTLLSCLTALLLFLLAAPCPAEAVPEPLRAWEGWLLDGQPAGAACPFRSGGDGLQRQCVWAEQLTLAVRDTGIEFTLDVSTTARVWVRLPGSQTLWPSAVSLEERELAVVTEPGQAQKAPPVPGVVLDAGRHRLVGHIPLTRPVQSIPLPPHRGIVRLSLNGSELASVDIDDANTLWLQRPSRAGADSGKGEAIGLKVFRKLTDGIPITLETRLELSVSGRAREVTLGQLRLADTVLTYFQSELPARVERDGRLRIQLRAGTWEVVTRARYEHPATRFSFEQRSGEWPDHEIWAFEASPGLRAVKVAGASSIDPRQLSGPAQWRQLPTYRLSPGQALTVEELYRGEITPPANQLAVARTIWMNFDRSGAVVRDEVSGTMASGWRLTAAGDVHLGRASIDGQPQVITRLADGSAGVEIRQARLRLETVSQLDRAGRFSASGWREDVDGLSAKLLLPPGWQLWHVAGPDAVSSSWLSRWNLWDIFICLLVVATAAKVLGGRWAALGLVLLALVYHDAGAPVAACTALLFALALLLVLPAHPFRRVVLGLSFALGALVLATVLSSLVEAMRQSIFPQLEYNRAIVAGSYGEISDFSSAGTVAPVGAGMEASLSRRKVAAEDAPAPPPPARYQATPENIQTGPGLPAWQWHSASLHWSGPVTAEERVEVYATPPLVTRLLRLLQVLLMAAFAGRILLTLWRLREPVAGRGSQLPAPGTAAALALLLWLAPGTAPEAAAEVAFPPQHLLKEYQRRLLQPPECGTACYSVNRLAVLAAQDRLELQLVIAVLEPIGVPLPRFGRGWQPERITSDQTAVTRLLQQDGQWYLFLEPGVHAVSISGALTGDSFRLDTPAAHNVSVSAPGWEVSGLTENRLAGGSLVLSRKRDARESKALFPDPIAPYVAVYRRLMLDHDWTVETTVRRLAPDRGSLHIRVPLLPDEEIRVAGFEPEQGSVAVSLKGGQQAVSWRSAIEPRERYVLVNRSGPEIAEYWSLDASPRWRVGTEGITAVVADGDAPEQRAQLHWRPWPGEELTLIAMRPTPVQGATVTLESVRWQFIPGERSSLVKLELTLLASIGQDYAITPPDDAELEKLAVDGRERSLPSAAKVLSVPLHPGLQTVTAQWRLPEGVATTVRTPDLTLDSPPSNIELSIQLPRNRWPLFLGGPPMGPAMLYWGVLVVMLLVAVVLGTVVRRLGLSIPLSSWQWLLLILGMSTVNAVGSLWVFAWFFALEARGRYGPPPSRLRFNLMQLGIALLTLISAAVLLTTIPQSLLSYPDMQVMGNGSDNFHYRWYQDHSEGTLPAAWVFSVPIWAYRAAMLLWSLWLVFALMRWVRWAWAKFSHRGLWQKRQTET